MASGRAVVVAGGRDVVVVVAVSHALVCVALLVCWRWFWPGIARVSSVILIVAVALWVVTGRLISFSAQLLL